MWRHDRTYELGYLVSTGYQIFTDTWDTYVREHKPVLCEKIIKHYFFNEICCDEPDRFRHYINEHLERIMPYYNQLYMSELIKFDPMINHLLESNGRSIENLIKEATNSDSEVATILNNFAKGSRGLINVGDTEGKIDSENETYNRKYSETTDKTENESTDVTRDRTENTERNGTTNTNMKETQTTSGDKTRLYSDTPQKSVSGDIDETYLTNYTHDTDNTTVTTENTTDTTMTESTDVTENEKTNTERDLTSNQKIDGTIEDTRDKTFNSNRTQKTDTNQQAFENGREDRNESRGKINTSNEKSTNDKGESTLVKGYLNVSGSELLEAFRRTFINIDQQIIEALSPNFMEVF